MRATKSPEVEPVEAAGREETEPTVVEAKSPTVKVVETAREPRSARERVLVWAVPLLVLGVLIAGLVTWWRATGHDQEMVDDAARRDRVLIVATSHIETLNSLD